MVQGNVHMHLRGITEVEGVLEASCKEQPTFQKEKRARRSCQVGAITLAETLRQDIRRLVQGTACNCTG